MFHGLMNNPVYEEQYQILIELYYIPNIKQHTTQKTSKRKSTETTEKQHCIGTEL
jgi:hypothetical protein